jgi:hypothetical protein
MSANIIIISRIKVKVLELWQRSVEWWHVSRNENGVMLLIAICALIDAFRNKYELLTALLCFIVGNYLSKWYFRKELRIGRRLFFVAQIIALSWALLSYLYETGMFGTSIMEGFVAFYVGYWLIKRKTRFVWCFVWLGLLVSVLAIWWIWRHGTPELWHQTIAVLGNIALIISIIVGCIVLLIVSSIKGIISFIKRLII